MRLPRIPTLLVSAIWCLSGCCSFNGPHPKDPAWVSHKGGVAQHGDVVQKGHVHPKGGIGHIAQKGGHSKGSKGVNYKAMMHQNLWNHYEPSGCCDNWDPILGSCNACGVCGGDCQGHTPAQHLKHMLTCASGCGEIYWGEWISDPPDACDPCDDWGNWTGPVHCGGPSCWDSLTSGWCNLFGYRGVEGKGGKGGCDSCGGKGGCDHCGNGPIVHGPAIHSPGSNAPTEYYDEMPALQDDEVVPTPQIDTTQPAALLPRSAGGFSLRSTRFTR